MLWKCTKRVDKIYSVPKFSQKMWIYFLANVICEAFQLCGTLEFSLGEEVLIPFLSLKTTSIFIVLLKPLFYLTHRKTYFYNYMYDSLKELIGMSLLFVSLFRRIN